jgi:hypothetical protein
VRVVPEALLAPNVTLTMRKPNAASGANTHATLTRFVVAVAVPLSVPAPLILPPGGPVVSISTRVELPTNESPVAGGGDGDGVGADEGMREGEDEPEAPDDWLPDGDRLPVGVLVPLAAAAVRELEGVKVAESDLEGEIDGVLEEVLEEPPDAVPVGVLLPLGAAPVRDPLAEREPLGVPELLRVGVPKGVYVGDGVEDKEDPPDDKAEAVAERVGEGEGSVTPIT